jgi:hypothetical protein
MTPAFTMMAVPADVAAAAGMAMTTRANHAQASIRKKLNLMARAAPPSSHTRHISDDSKVTHQIGTFLMLRQDQATDTWQEFLNHRDRLPAGLAAVRGLQIMRGEPLAYPALPSKRDGGWSWAQSAANPSPPRFP